MSYNCHDSTLLDETSKVSASCLKAALTNGGQSNYNLFIYPIPMPLRKAIHTKKIYLNQNMARYNWQTTETALLVLQFQMQLFQNATSGGQNKQFEEGAFANGRTFWW